MTMPRDRGTDNSPLKRPIGLHGFVALLGVIGLGAGVAKRHYTVAAAGLLFVALALRLAYREWRSHNDRHGNPR